MSLAPMKMTEYFKHKSLFDFFLFMLNTPQRLYHFLHLSRLWASLIQKAEKVVYLFLPSCMAG
jgi:hypothetical protein